MHKVMGAWAIHTARFSTQQRDCLLWGSSDAHSRVMASGHDQHLHAKAARQSVICTQSTQPACEETVHPATERYTKGLKKHHVDQSSTTYLFICLQIHVVFPWRYCIYLYIYLYTNRHIYSHIYIYPRFTLHSRFLFVGAPLHIQVGLRNPLQNSYYPRPYKSYKP